MRIYPTLGLFFPIGCLFMLLAGCEMEKPKTTVEKKMTVSDSLRKVFLSTVDLLGKNVLLPVGLDSLVQRVDSSVDLAYGIFDFREDFKAIHYFFTRTENQYSLTTTYLSVDTVGVSISEGRLPTKTRKDSASKKGITKEDWRQIESWFMDAEFWNLSPYDFGVNRCSLCCDFEIVVFDGWRKQQFMGDTTPCYQRQRHSITRKCMHSSRLLSLRYFLRTGIKVD